MANGTQNSSLALHASRDLDDGLDQNLTDMLADDSIVASGGEKVGILLDIDNEVGRQDMEKEKLYVGKVVGMMGQAYRYMKDYSRRMGIEVQPTPRISTPKPTGPPPKMARIMENNGKFAPILPPGLDPKATLQGNKCWMDLRVPPPGYAFIPTKKSATRRVTRWDVGPSGSAAASNSSGYKDPSNVRERLGWRRNEEGQKRNLGGRCGKCYGEHKTYECTHHPEDLRCRYPPCKNKIGHVASVCHELNKSCNLPVCKGAWGHRSFCHSTIPVEGGEPYGYTEEAAEKLKEEFRKFSHLLTDADWEGMAAVNNSGREELGGTERRGPIRGGRGRGGNGGPYGR